MIFITGDTHSDFRRFSVDSFYEQKEFSDNPEDNFVIICGDFGGVWYNPEIPESAANIKKENYWLDWLNSKPWTTCFVDGNHENFSRIYNFPEEEWHGGKVHNIRKNIKHLMRGEVFTIEEKKFFCFGGARSHDIQDGLIDVNDSDWKSQAKLWTKQNKMFRIKGLSWWEQEMPSQKEMDHGIETLDSIEWNVDYVVTHCCASSTQALICHGMYKPDELTKYLEDIRSKLNYKKWFFGHYHDNRNINAQEILLYEQIVRIN